MVIDSSYYEEEFLDGDELEFQKLTRKKQVKRNKQSPIQDKRKEKMRQRDETIEHFI